MTYEQMKFRLGDYRRCVRYYERHCRELELLEKKLEYAGISVDYSKPGVRGTVPGNAAFADWITEALFLKKQLEDEAGEVEAAGRDVAALIDTLQDPDYKDILRYKYLNGWDWWEIGKVMGYSPDWARHKAYKAIMILAEKDNHPQPPCL